MKCNICKEYKTADLFETRAGRPTSRCRKCKNEYNRKLTKKQRDNSLKHMLKHRVISRIKWAYKLKGWDKPKSAENVLGCTWEYYEKHILKLMKEGMTIKNKEDWHIDHILPVSMAKTPVELNALLNYRNTQPMWKIDNIKKGSKFLCPNTCIKK